MFVRGSNQAIAIKNDIDRIVNGRALKAFDEVYEIVDLAVKRLKLPENTMEPYDRHHYVKLGLFCF